MKKENVLVVLLVVVCALILFVLIPQWNGVWHMNLQGDYSRDNMHTEEVNSHHDDDDIEDEQYSIYPGVVAEKIADGEDIVLLDVRSYDAYRDAHVVGAHIIPFETLSQQTLDEKGLGVAMKDKEIIVYSRSGTESERAVTILSSLGYSNVKSVSGGIIHWQEDKYPFIESGEYTSSKEDQKIITDVKDAPKVVVDRTLHEFGAIPQYGGIVETDFEITNEGNTALKIGDVTTSCSCTSAEVSTKTIEPGTTATLTVTFDPDFHEEPLGAFRRTVFIPTNDPVAGEIEVAIAVDIIEGE